MRRIYGQGEEDCKWLKETHLCHYNDVVPAFKSFTLVGNEDFPDEIELYTSEQPRWDISPVLRLHEGDGQYHRVEEEEL